MINGADLLLGALVGNLRSESRNRQSDKFEFNCGGDEL
jgi:hypothetical protein